MPGADAIPNVSKPNAYCVNIAYLMKIPSIYNSYTFHIVTAPDLSAFQADLKGGSGAISLDLELLKQFRVSAVAPERIEGPAPSDSVWLEYAYRKHHPVLHYLPAKLAELIGENMQNKLGFPEKKDPNK